MKSFALVLLTLLSTEALAANPELGATSSETIGIRVSVVPRFGVRWDEARGTMCLEANFSGVVRAITTRGKAVPNCVTRASARTWRPATGLFLIVPE